MIVLAIVLLVIGIALLLLPIPLPNVDTVGWLLIGLGVVLLIVAVLVGVLDGTDLNVHGTLLGPR